MTPQVFFSEDTSVDRRLIAETYSGQFRHPSIRLSLKSGPVGTWNIVNLRMEEFDKVVTAYLRFKAADGG